MDKNNIDKKILMGMYEGMLTTRKFEEKVAKCFQMGLLHGTCHLCIGEEATSIGATHALEKQDLIFPTHRGHGQDIGKGIDLNKMMAELFGKADGVCKGKGGSMHICDIENGNMGANGIVGGGIPLSVGAGLSTKILNIDRVVVCFFGDGATNEGAFHEALNLASTWKLPVVFICVNNQYGMSTHISKCTNINDLSLRAVSYGIPGKSIDGNDVIGVYKTVKKAREYVKKKGPILIVANTYRTTGHSKSDANKYRTKEEIELWKRKCPIKRFKKYLIQNNIVSQEELDDIDKKTTELIEKSVEYAQSSPEPSIDTVADDVYA